MRSEQGRIRERCGHPSGRFVEFCAEDVEQSVSARFEQQAALHGSRPAIRTATGELSYRELDLLANRIARAIVARLGEGNEPVAVLFEHGAAGIAAILAVLKAGKCYLPLDPASPVARTTGLLTDARARVIVTDTRCRGLADDVAAGRVGVLDVDDLDPTAPAESPGLRVPPAAAASLYYTSGSTGRPKGVVETHRNRLINARRTINAIRITAEDRLVLLYTAGFSGSVNCIFGALLSGACLCPFDLRADGYTALARWLREQEITIYHSTPPVFRGLVDSLGAEDAFPALRILLLASDSLYATDVERYRQHFADSCLLLNSWGATESPFFRPYFLDKATELPGGAVPAIGPSVEEDEIRLLDERGDAVAPGQAGEIVVTSRYLSPGYWGLEDVTRARFRSVGAGSRDRAYFTGDLGRMLPDGSIVHLGRTDFQIKVRGYRVEPGEIETALRKLAGIRDAVVMGQTGAHDDHRLVAYLVPGDGAPAVGWLQHALRESLPDYLVPARFVFLPALPLTPNGKIDRLALPDPGRTRPALNVPLRTPGSPLERTLARIWEAALGLDEIGIDDDFLELGGDSLRAMQVVTRVQEAYGVEVPVRALFEAPSVARMALAIVEHQAAHLTPSDVEQLLGERGGSGGARAGDGEGPHGSS
jgi:amino acid adenylation domain-containing protein